MSALAHVPDVYLESPATFTLSTETFLAKYGQAYLTYLEQRERHLTALFKWEAQRRAYLTTLFRGRVTAEIPYLKAFLRARRREMKQDIRQAFKALLPWQWHKRAKLQRSIKGWLAYDTIGWMKHVGIVSEHYQDNIDNDPLRWFVRRVTTLGKGIGPNYLSGDVLANRTEAPVMDPDRAILHADRHAVSHWVTKFLYNYEDTYPPFYPLTWPEQPELHMALKGAQAKTGEQALEMTVTAKVILQADQVVAWVDQSSVEGFIARLATVDPTQGKAPPSWRDVPPAVNPSSHS